MLNLSILSPAPDHTMAMSCDLGSQNSFPLISMGKKKWIVFLTSLGYSASMLYSRIHTKCSPYHHLVS